MGMRLILVGAALAGTVVIPQQASQVAREQTADQQVRHVLNRLAFGARPGDYDRVRQMGVDAWIAQQLNPDKLDDASVTRLIAELPTYTMTPEKLIEEYPRPPQAEKIEREKALEAAKTQADTQRVRRQFAGDGTPKPAILPQLQAARLGRAVVSERQLQEVLVDFWLNHFSVYAGKNQQMRYYLADYERNVIRPRVFGKFRDMLEAVAKSPAMLIYLDNYQSIADTGRINLATYGGQGDPSRRRAVGRGAIIGGRPLPTPQQQKRASGLNENYGRELLELHTMGVDGGYTQKDVTEVARALTGWTIVPAQGQQLARAATRMGGAIVEGHFLFRAQVHDAEPKTILGVKMKGGRGIEDGEQVLDIVAAHPSTAKYIAKKLAIRFISDAPPQSIIDRAAATFTKTGGDLRETVRTIITSPEFFSTAAYRAKVKSPFEVVASALRAVGAPADATPRSAQEAARLGQGIFNHQTPDGWPETGDEWINTGSILDRINFGIELASGRVPGANPNSWPLPPNVKSQAKEAQVDAVVAAFLGGEVSPETRKILLSGNNPLLSSANADSSDANMMRQPPDTAGVTGLDPAMLRRGRGGRGGRAGPLPPLDGVPLIVGLALGSPEFQRR